MELVTNEAIMAKLVEIEKLIFGEASHEDLQIQLDHISSRLRNIEESIGNELIRLGDQEYKNKRERRDDILSIVSGVLEKSL